jgi:hypothetical protein
MEPKIIIAGTGRAGTSFLVRLLTRLGYDTGYTPDREDFHPTIRAGCEQFAGDWSRGWWEQSPRIVKSPFLSITLPSIRVPIDHVICPVRDLDQVQQSREENNLPWAVPPVEVLGKLVADCTLLGIPLTLMRFPDSVRDWGYCLLYLSEAFPELNSQPGRFEAAFRGLQPEAVS